MTMIDKNIAIDIANGSSYGLSLRNSSSLLRWTMTKTTALETGANAGSHFAIGRYEDNGNYISTPIYIRRDTGRVGINDVFSPSEALDVSGNVKATFYKGNGALLTGIVAGVGLFRGNNGERGDTVSGAGDIFRINSNTITQDVTIAAGENAMAAGPLTVASGKTITIQSGGRMVIV
jgi:hypothetical protein